MNHDGAWYDLCMKTKISALAAVLTLASGAAHAGLFEDQLSAGQVLGTRAKADMAAAAEQRKQAKPAPNSCPDARTLETSFEMTLLMGSGAAPRTIHFSYQGCRAEGRNDYLPPYTERNYSGEGGYGLTIVTDDGAGQSEVLMSQGKNWVGRFGKFGNNALVSNGVIEAGAVEMQAGGAAVKAWARLQGAPPALETLYPELKTCEAVVGKQKGWGRTSIMLVTDSAAYYQHEDCDICAELTRCDLKGGALASVITAHMVSCEDILPYKKGKIVYDSCAK